MKELNKEINDLYKSIIIDFPDCRKKILQKSFGYWNSNSWKVSALKIFGDHEVANALQEFFDKAAPYRFKNAIVNQLEQKTLKVLCLGGRYCGIQG